MLLGWMILIFHLSHQPAAMSTEVSDSWTGWIAGILSHLFFWIDEGKLSAFLLEHVEYVRKAAHIFEYLVLGFLASINCREYFNKRTLLVPFIFCIVYALSDEIHQLFIPGRAGKAADVLIDSFGALVGILLYHLIKRNEKDTDHSTDPDDRLSE